MRHIRKFLDSKYGQIGYMLQLHAMGEPTHNQCLGQFIGHNRIEEEQLVYSLHSLPEEDGIQQFARRYFEVIR